MLVAKIRCRLVIPLDLRINFVLIGEVQTLDGDVALSLYIWEFAKIVQILAESLLVLKISHIVSDSAWTIIRRKLLNRPIIQLPLFLQNLQGFCGVVNLFESTVSRVNFDEFLDLFRAVVRQLFKLVSGVLELLYIGFFLLIIFNNLTVRKLNRRPILK